MPDVSSKAPADVRLWVSFDEHKFSIVAASLPPCGGQPELHRIETTENERDHGNLARSAADVEAGSLRRRGLVPRSASTTVDG
jgi:hypothetical protein